MSRIFDKYLKFYAGIVVNPWTNEEFPGLHEPMISPEEYFQIRNILTGKGNKVKKSRVNPNFPLRRTVKCGYCGWPLTGSCSRGRNHKYYYYHCYNKACSMRWKAISKNDLEADFLAYLEKVTPTQRFLDHFKAVVLDSWAENGRSLKLEAAQYEKQLATLEEKRKRIFEMREDGSYTAEEFKERKEEIENRIIATKISLSETRIDQFDVEGVLSYVTKFIANLGRQWLDLAASQTRFQKLIFPEGIPYKRDEGFGTARLGLIYELNRTCVEAKSLEVHLRGNGWNQIVSELRFWQREMELLEPLLVA